MHTFCRCNEGTIDDGPVKNPNRAGCNVIETIRVLKFLQVQGSLQLARKIALDQVAYANEAGCLKILKILGFSRCNEGKIVDGAVNNPNPTGCNVIETIVNRPPDTLLRNKLSAPDTLLRGAGYFVTAPKVRGSLQLAKKGCTRSSSIRE